MLCFDDGLRSVVERSVYGTPKPYNFEDRTLLGVEQADKLLTKMYGDYMTPPPAKEQVGLHLQGVDFGKY